MIEIFRTNVENQAQANRLINVIQKTYPGLKANFDLDDCDRILRIVSLNGAIPHSGLVDLVKKMGFVAELLPDN